MDDWTEHGCEGERFRPEIERIERGESGEDSGVVVLCTKYSDRGYAAKEGDDVVEVPSQSRTDIDVNGGLRFSRDYTDFLSVLIISADATTLSVSIVVENVGMIFSWNFVSLICLKA